MLLSLVLMTLDHRWHQLEAVRATLSVVVYPLRFLVNLPVTTGEWFRESLATRHRLEEENARLRTQHLVYQAQLQKLDALRQENARLRHLLQSSFKVGERVLIAELLAVDLDPYRHEILVNKGSRAGVFEGQPLVDAHGIMGQVIHVTPFTATAMLITDPAHAIPVQDNRTGVRTIALGTGHLNLLRLPNLPNNTDVAPGDLFVTSGLGGRFPPGYPVAVVTQVARDPGQSFARITARPLAHLDRSREVLLVWPRTPGAESTPPAATPAPAAKGAAHP